MFEYFALGDAAVRRAGAVKAFLSGVGALGGCKLVAANAFLINSTEGTTDAASGSVTLDGLADAVVTIPAGCKDSGLSVGDKVVSTPVSLRVLVPAGVQGVRLSAVLALAGF